ncbi:MAG: hypothetical protein ACI3V3_02925 [Faecousia sp.]
MKKIHGGISLFRAANLGNILPFSVIVMGFTGFVLLRALSVSYSGVPWFAWPIVGFVLGGFVFMFLAGFGTLLFCTQRVEIGSDEIVVRLGPLVFRRMQALSVHTIGFGEIASGKGNPTFDGFLILSSRTPDEVEAAGRRILEKSALSDIGISAGALIWTTGQPDAGHGSTAVCCICFCALIETSFWVLHRND